MENINAGCSIGGHISLGRDGSNQNFLGLNDCICFPVSRKHLNESHLGSRNVRCVTATVNACDVLAIDIGGHYLIVGATADIPAFDFGFFIQQ